ncbi:hypothetical protein [Streptomyces sp. H27-D2]|uniref:hypothetical protein n=1 Tax=Streptomyces sp. H27-D2 TaxID=3046304 RepID=UPI002DBF048D|nr:hypothetical protein [Streptomyces sp. H27-D2]MEC4017985.1 hypothetical protein [Streptomyces sp. H27-D2]
MPGNRHIQGNGFVRNTASRAPVGPRAPTTPPSRPTAPSITASQQAGLNAWAGNGIRKGIRDKKDKKRIAALENAAGRIVNVMTGGLPAGARVLEIDVTPDLADLVYAALPDGLKNDGALTALRYELCPAELAAKGKDFIGSGSYHLSRFEGTSSNWRYKCDVGLSLTPTGEPERVATTAASMDSSRAEEGGLATKRSQATGPTISAGLVGGQLASVQPGGTGNMNLAYKKETTKDFASTKSYCQTNNLKYPEGTAEFVTKAELQITIRYTKKTKALSKWARSHHENKEKELVLDKNGCQNADKLVEPVPNSQKIFGDVSIRYGIPRDLVDRHGKGAQIETQTEGEEIFV